jgi:hypothetical protein
LEAGETGLGRMDRSDFKSGHEVPPTLRRSRQSLAERS